MLDKPMALKHGVCSRDPLGRWLWRDRLLASTGTAILEITATESDGQSVSATLVVTVSGDPVQQWRSANFSAADLADPAKEATVWGSAALPDGDLWSSGVASQRIASRDEKWYIPRRS